MTSQAQEAHAWLKDENNQYAVFIVVATAFVETATATPIGFSGLGLVLAVLVVLNVAFAVGSRALPLQLSKRPAGVALMAVGSILAAAFMNLSASGWSCVFAFTLTGNFGFRLPIKPALLLAGFTSVLCSIALLFPYQDVDFPWYLGALTGLSSLLGVINRNNAHAIHSAQLAQEQAERASAAEARAQALTERARIARDVHDVLAHSLAGVNMQLEVTDALLEAGDIERAREAAGRAQSLVREGLSEVQRTVSSLREEAVPLVETLQSMIRATVDETTQLQVKGDVAPLSAKAIQALVRCAQEALTNARKYAPNSPVLAALSFDAHAAHLEITNGPQVVSSQPLPKGSGMGLVGMSERVALVGGSVQAGPVTEGNYRGGWSVKVMVPR